MPIKLDKNSSEFDRNSEKFLELRPQTKYQRLFNTPAFYVGISLLLSLVILIQDLMLMDASASPQFHIVLKEGNNESASILTGIRQSFQMVTFLAEDFSLSNYTGINDIDSLDVGVEYDLFYQGYKKNSSNGEYFIETSGLDVFSCIVHDVSVQLAHISKAESPQNVTKSLLATYSHTIMNFDEMYAEAKRTGEYPPHFDETKLKLGHKAYSLEKYGKVMINYPSIAPFVSLAALMSLLILTNILFFRTVNQKVMISFTLVQAVQLITLTIAWGSELHMWHGLSRSFHKLNVACMTAGSGFKILEFKLVLALVVQALLVYVTIKRFNTI